MYHVSICMYLGKYWQVFLSRYVEIDQFVFHKNTYAILTTRFTDDKTEMPETSKPFEFKDENLV